jgi:flagellar hook-length control protein FliK
VLPTVPTQATAPSAAAAAPSAPAPVAAPPLAEQLGVRLGALRHAPLGEHVLTLRVEPDAIGPVRVVAHISADGVRIELAGATDQAAQALRGALADLRRDLAATGMRADLQLAGDGAGANAQNGRAGAEQDRPTGRGTGGLPVAGAAPSAEPEPSPSATGRRGLDLVL